MSKNNLQEERRRIMGEIFDLYDSEHTGYVEIKESFKLLQSMGRKMEPEDENEFISLADPKKEGRISKQNFLDAVQAMYTIPDEFVPEIKDAFNFFDRDNDGKISCKEFKDVLVKFSKEYQEKDVDELFKILDLDMNGKITIDEFINLWRFQ